MEPSYNGLRSQQQGERLGRIPWEAYNLELLVVVTTSTQCSSTPALRYIWVLLESLPPSATQRSSRPAYAPLRVASTMPKPSLLLAFRGRRNSKYWGKCAIQIPWGKGMLSRYAPKLFAAEGCVLLAEPPVCGGGGLWLGAKRYCWTIWIAGRCL
jgi:hypothetical protein